MLDEAAELVTMDDNGYQMKIEVEVIGNIDEYMEHSPDESLQWLVKKITSRFVILDAMEIDFQGKSQL